MQLDEVRKDLNEEYRIVEGDLRASGECCWTAKRLSGGAGLRKATKITQEMLDGLEQEDQWFKLRWRR